MAFSQQIPMTIQGDFISPVDGTVVYTSGVTLTASGFPFTVDDTVSYIISIRVKNTSGSWTTYVNGYSGINIRSSVNVITMSGVTTPFLNTDTLYLVNIKYQQKAYDLTSDSLKSIITGAYWGSKFIGPIPIISAAQTVTTSFADLGAAFEIPCFGYYAMGIWIKLTINQSLGVQIQALAKHTSQGTDEYNLPIEEISSGLITISSEVLQFPDANGLYLLKCTLNNIVPFVQLQIKMTTDGGTDATADSCLVTLGY